MLEKKLRNTELSCLHDLVKRTVWIIDFEYIHIEQATDILHGMKQN